jgi:hypothetical protein
VYHTIAGDVVDAQLADVQLSILKLGMWPRLAANAPTASRPMATAPRAVAPIAKAPNAAARPATAEGGCIVFGLPPAIAFAAATLAFRLTARRSPADW